MKQLKLKQDLKERLSQSSYLNILKATVCIMIPANLIVGAIYLISENIGRILFAIILVFNIMAAVVLSVLPFYFFFVILPLWRKAHIFTFIYEEGKFQIAKDDKMIVDVSRRDIKNIQCKKENGNYLIVIEFIKNGEKELEVINLKNFNQSDQNSLLDWIMPFEEVDKWVDLGLPSGTLWAKCNVGASNPEEYGYYFAWGETKPKSRYDWSTYKHCKGLVDTLTNYCLSSSFGDKDDKDELLSMDDAATSNWGDNWQMPSRTQFEELINENYTTIKWTWQNGIYGKLITSKSNGESIFLPSAGAYGETNDLYKGKEGFYWSRSLDTYYSLKAYNLLFYSGGVKCYYSMRGYGFTVRPVLKRNLL